VGFEVQKWISKQIFLQSHRLSRYIVLKITNTHEINNKGGTQLEEKNSVKQQLLVKEQLSLCLIKNHTMEKYNCA
jgi:hypothetical protein